MPHDCSLIKIVHQSESGRWEFNMTDVAMQDRAWRKWAQGVICRESSTCSCKRKCFCDCKRQSHRNNFLYNYKIYVSSWWTVVFLRSQYPKSCYCHVAGGWSSSWYRSWSSLHQPEFSPRNSSVSPVEAYNSVWPYGLDTSQRKYNKKAISASNQKLAFNQNTWLLKMNFRSEFLIGLSITSLFLHITLNFLVAVATVPNFSGYQNELFHFRPCWISLYFSQDGSLTPIKTLKNTHSSDFNHSQLHA